MPQFNFSTLKFLDYTRFPAYFYIKDEVLVGVFINGVCLGFIRLNKIFLIEYLNLPLPMFSLGKISGTHLL